MRPLKGQQVDNKEQLKKVLDDITANGYRINQFIGDKPKRSFAKDCKGSCSWFACEYCFSKGIKIEISKNSSAQKKIGQQIQFVQQKLNELNSMSISDEVHSQIQNMKSLKDELQKSLNSLKRKSHILWPHSTMKGQNRSRSAILDIVRRIENNEDLTIDEAKGVKGRSLLLDLPHFNYVYDAPAEYWHSGCLGLTKRLIELTFNVGVHRSRVTKRKLTPPELFDKLMSITKVVCDFSRRARNLDFAVFKAQEFRNISLFFFVLVYKCLEEDAKERHLWLYLAYMMRSAVIPSDEFSKINISDVNDCCDKFYRLFEKLFGETNCPYNLHVFCSHLMEIRTHGPLTETSAFKFESFYGEMRRSFVSGTISPMKQIMKNIFLKRYLKDHVCKKDIVITNYETSMERNNLIYTYVKNEYAIYQVSDIDDNFATCNKMGQYPVHFEETPNLDWSKVGVFKKGGINSTSTKIKTSDVCGKVLIVDNYLLTCPYNVLDEK